MQDENNIFSDIPGLDNPDGLQQYLENQVVAQNTPDAVIPAALQQTNPNPEVGNPQPAGTENPAQQTFTSEQVQAIINAVRQQQATTVQQTAPRQQAAQTTPQQSYTPQEMSAINAMLSRGYSLEQVMRAVQSNRARSNGGVDPAVIQKINNIENYLQNQQYQAAQNEFIDKMTTFGNKFGLSENDLVTFGNQALAKGINLTTVSDVEMVFKAMYPEQYAIRVQRMSNTPTSQIYGGTSVSENNQVVNEKAMDAYVDAFLKRSMPNQYGMQKK